MPKKQNSHSLREWLVGGAAVAAASYVAYAGITWLRYGRPARKISGEETDSLLDLYMPEYEIAERHQVHVRAAAETTFTAACEVKLQSGITQAIFKARELALDCIGHKDASRQLKDCNGSGQINLEAKGLVEEIKAQGWGILAEIPGHEIVFGTVTRPWVTNTVFRSVPSEQFAAFHEPNYVKIVFTLRADPIAASESLARTETRVMTTDEAARKRFRRYWAIFSPGIRLIRRALLRRVKSDAEHRAETSIPEYETAEFGEFAER
jgi:hypothetical protein